MRAGLEPGPREQDPTNVPYLLIAIGVAVGLIIGVSVGLILIGPQGKAIEVAGPVLVTPYASEAIPTPAPVPATSAGLQARDPESRGPASHSLAELGLRIPEPALPERWDGQDWEDLGSDAIGGLIAGMSNGELIDTVASTALFTPEELDDMSDVRGFAERLAEIALAGVVTPQAAPSPAAQQVEFSTTVEADNSATLPSGVFSADADRIYAVFPTDQYVRDSVLAKWQRLDQPELMIFDRYPIHSRERHNFVWMSPPEGWTEGSYEVTIYSTDEMLDPVAVGAYDVVGDTVE